MSKIKLLPCPFCGGESQISVMKYGRSPGYFVWCDYCGCRTETQISEKDATSTWNRRTKENRADS